MEEKQLSEKESFLLIQQMINTAKKEEVDDGKGWILWGWLLFFSSLFTLVNLQLNIVSHYFFWNAFGITSILLLLYGTISKRLSMQKQRVRTYTKDLLSKLNTGFIISLGLIIISINKGVPPTKGFALLLGLYGFWIMIYGAALNFRPSIYGAYITWGFALASMFVVDFGWTMLLHAAAVLCGYIIPGHLAHREFKKLQTKDKVAEGV